MSLPRLYAVPENPEDWRGWAFNHAALHYTVIDAVGRQKQQNLTQYPLFPFDTADPVVWLWRHQASHSQVNAALQLNGFDLLGFDWTDPGQFELWIQCNGEEHTRWATILGVG